MALNRQQVPDGVVHINRGCASSVDDSDQAAAYRLQTRVRKFVSNPKTFPTFTLPRYVDLAQ